MDLLKDLSIDKVRNLAEDAFNQAKPKTDVEARVYEVLSHKNWGASSSIMNQIARDTFDYDKFAVISKITWENVETQRPSAWRVIFKGLTLVEHLVKNGSERCVDDARNHGHILRQLHQFNYYEGTVDRGQGVREKSKQLVEILGDNERIREERQKARKLREKFNGRGATATSGGGGYSGGDGWNSGGGGGGGGSGGGGGGGWDAGGNDGAWNSGGGGYGEGGIDSGSGARGRYDDDRGATSQPSSSSGPTFAQIPAKKKTSKPGTKKVKKKKAPEASAPAPAADVDLFSFDDPSPAPAPPAAAASDDDFSGFQSAAAPAAAAAAASSDPFGGDPFSSAPSTTPQQAAAPVVDPFAAPITQQPQAVAGMSNMTDMFGNMSMGGNMPHQGGMMMGGANPMMGVNNSMMMMGNNMMGGNAMMGNNPMMGGSAMMGGNNSLMGGAKPPAPAPAKVAAAFDDDDFGDFEAAGGQPAQASPVKSSDPFGNLVSLDGLSRNTKKEEDKINQPIVINAAAAQYMQDKQMGLGAAAPKDSAKSAAMSFAGIDGLPKSTPALSMGLGMGMGMSSPAASSGMNPNVMASGGSGNASLIGMLDPQTMIPPKPVQQPPQQVGGMVGMNPQMMQMMMQNPQMMQQMMASGQMTPQQQQQMMQMMMMSQQMMGGGQGGGANMMGGQGGAMGGNMMGGQGGPMGGGGW